MRTKSYYLLNKLKNLKAELYDSEETTEKNKIKESMISRCAYCGLSWPTSSKICHECGSQLLKV